MQTHFSRRDRFGSGFSIRRWGTMVIVIPVICLAVPLGWSLWLRQQTLANRPDLPASAESTEQQRLVTQQNQQITQQRSLIILLAVAVSVGILGSAAAWYLLNRLCRELQEQEQQLRENEFLTEAIATNVVDGIITLNHQGQMETFNPMAMQMFGYELAEVKGKDLSLLLPLPADEGAIAPVDRTKTITGKLFQPVRQQKRLGQHKVGTPFPIEVSISDILLNNRRVVIIHDVTQKEQAEAELTHRAGEIVRLNTTLTKTKSELQSVYVACYDLKSPLQAIAHLSKWIEADLNNQAAADTQPQMNLLRERVDRMEGLVNSVLQHSPEKEE